MVPHQSDFISGGVDTAAVGGTFDISNLDRLGFSEVRSILHLISQASMVWHQPSCFLTRFPFYWSAIRGFSTLESSKLNFGLNLSTFELVSRWFNES